MKRECASSCLPCNTLQFYCLILKRFIPCSFSQLPQSFHPAICVASRQGLLQPKSTSLVKCENHTPLAVYVAEHRSHLWRRFSSRKCGTSGLSVPLPRLDHRCSRWHFVEMFWNAFAAFELSAYNIIVWKWRPIVRSNPQFEEPRCEVPVDAYPSPSKRFAQTCVGRNQSPIRVE